MLEQEQALLKELEANPYIDYPSKPIILGPAQEAEYKERSDNAVIITLPSGERVSIPPDQQFSRVQGTMNGLLEDLVPGSELADEFYQKVWPNYEKALEENPERPTFGTLVFYPNRKDLVWYVPQEWHQIALLARNSLLIRDAEQTIGWAEQRQKLSPIVVGVAGASVGKNAFLRVIDTLQPDFIKIGDPRPYKDTNARRTDLSYWDTGRNKAIVAAEQAHRTDPFTGISVYQNGIHRGNIGDFVQGNEIIGEPPISDLIEETDDPDTKIDLGIAGRAYRKRVYRITDIGVAYQIDVRDYKKSPNLTLAVGVEDRKLLAAQEAWHNDMANRELFFEFAFKLIGDHWRTVPEFHDLILKQLETPFAGGIPQLGVAAHAGASHVALMVAQKALGYRLPERVFVDLRERRIVEIGDLI